MMTKAFGSSIGPAKVRINARTPRNRNEILKNMPRAVAGFLDIVLAVAATE